MEQFIAELVKQGGGYLLAGLAIVVIKYQADQAQKRSDEWRAEAKAWAEAERGRGDRALTAFEENARASVQLAEAINRLREESVTTQRCTATALTDMAAALKQLKARVQTKKVERT